MRKAKEDKPVSAWFSSRSWLPASYRAVQGPSRARKAIRLLGYPGSHCRKRPTLHSIFAEIVGHQPSFECRAQERPLAICDGEPGRVSAASLIDHGLAENAFVAKTITLRRPARRRVETVAFPFVAAVAQFIEDAAHEQIHRLGAGSRALQPQGVDDVTYLDHTIGTIDAHQRGRAHGLAAAGIDNYMMQGIGFDGFLAQIIDIFCELRKRPRQ